MPSSPASTLLIFGAGGHGRVVADAALAQGRWGQLRVTDRDARKCGTTLLPGLRVEAPDEALAGSAVVHIAIGSAASREREARAAGLPLATVAHPLASVSRYAGIGDGCFLAAQSVLAPGARIGIAVIVNHGAVVDHDCEVGDFTHVAPLVALGGEARIGKRVLLGSGSKVLPGVHIADDVIVGAGAVVCDHIPEPGTWVGVPARRVR